MSGFMALIAGMALMLGHATSHCGKERVHLLAHQRLGDRATVTRALDCIEPMPELHSDVLVVRCVALLRDLLVIEEDAARQNGLLSNPPNNANSQNHIIIMRAPYLGNIRISGEGISALSAVNVDQSQHMAEGVTIGGIGSMMLRRHGSAKVEQESHARKITATPVTFSSADFDAGRIESGHSQNVVPHATAMPHPPMVWNDVAPPFPAASFDDWDVQRVDSALMERLLRGSAVPPPDEMGGENWDINTFP